MKFSIDRHDKYSIITLEEEKLNSVNAPKFKSELVLQNAEGARNLIVDLSRVTFIDSSGLSAILVGNRICKQSGGTFVLCCISDNVNKLIKISQLDSILNLVPTLSEASDLVMMDELERDMRNGNN